MADTTPTIPAEPSGGGGVIGALKLFRYQVGLTVEAVSADLDKLAEKAVAARAAVEEAEKVSNESTLDAGKSTQIGESVGSSSSASAALAEVTSSLTQQVGRR